jgi:HSP20 family protein
MLTRWDPFREMISLRREMDRLFDTALSGSQQAGWQPASWDLALDVVESEDEYVVKASLPGINPDDLEITFTNNTLTIKGEVREDQDFEQAQYHVRERRSGMFARSISLPSGIESDQISANYENGILKLHLPKAEEVKPRRIQIQAGQSNRMIEGHAKNGGR